jgi:serine phosphatase RsbU (regulator of sigma subunit)
MRDLRLSSKILIPILVLLFVIPLAYDLYQFYSDVTIVVVDYVTEGLYILFAVLYYFFLINTFNFRDKSIEENLKIYVYLLGILYLSVILAKLLLNPSYSSADFPPLPETVSSVIYSNFISLFAVLFMIPILIVIKNLIYYKRTRRTYFFMRLLVIFSFATVISGVIFPNTNIFDFTGTGIYNDVLFSIVLLLIVLQSFRNSWITYLSRKEKVTYFFISLFIFWALLYLDKFAFNTTIPAHSFAASVFSTIAWYFQLSYVLFSGIYLLFQLPTARVFDRKMNEVSSLLDLGRVISTEFDFHKLIKLIPEMAIKVIGAESIWLELYKSDSKELYIASSQNIHEAEIAEFGKSGRQILSEEILSTRKPILLNEIGKNHPYAYLREWKSDISSIIGAPLISGNGKPLGILFATKKYTFGFYPDDLAMLEAYANQGVIALDNTTLLKESFERERMEEELRIAREVQQRLLPHKTPKYNGISIEALTITAYEVGGDYYDYINFSDDQLGFIIGDVSGKGTSAAFYMAEAKGIVQSLSKSFQQPRELLIRTNEILYETLERKSFISMLMASLNCNTNTLSFARAGHCPLLYYNSKVNEASLLQPEGIGVGLEKGVIFRKKLKEEKVKCQSGDIFAFYTDGLSEARNHDGEEYGDERLRALIETNATKTAPELKDIVIDSILSFLDGQSLSDDLTLLLVKL